MSQILFSPQTVFIQVFLQNFSDSKREATINVRYNMVFR